MIEIVHHLLNETDVTENAVRMFEFELGLFDRPPFKPITGPEVINNFEQLVQEL